VNGGCVSRTANDVITFIGESNSVVVEKSKLK
jgi:hypothetical protein